MIIFDLLCACGCQFEGWFNDQLEYRSQLQKRMLTCPSCGGNEVHKILSPVALRRTAGSELQDRGGMPTIEPSEKERSARLLQAVQKLVMDNFEDVGTKLAEESLKMHYGASQPRNIRGVASWEEEKMLREEGVELLKISLPVSEEDVH